MCTCWCSHMCACTSSSASTPTCTSRAASTYAFAQTDAYTPCTFLTRVTMFTSIDGLHHRTSHMKRVCIATNRCSLLISLHVSACTWGWLLDGHNTGPYIMIQFVECWSPCFGTLVLGNLPYASMRSLRGGLAYLRRQPVLLDMDSNPAGIEVISHSRGPRCSALRIYDGGCDRSPTARRRPTDRNVRTAGAAVVRSSHVDMDHGQLPL